MAFKSASIASGPGSPAVFTPGGGVLGTVGARGPIRPFQFFTPPPATFIPPLIVGTWNDVNVDQFPYIPFMWAMGALQSVQDMEMFNWGFASSTLGAGGTQLMGFRGFWSLRAAMGSIEASNEAITEDFVAEMVSVDLQYVFVPQLGIHFAEEEQFGFDTSVVTTVQQAFDQDEGIGTQQLVRQGTSEDEAITEDFLQEMFSSDLLFTFPLSNNFILDEEPFGFQTQVATTILGFDQDELVVTARTMYEEDEAFGFEVEWAETKEQEFIMGAGLSGIGLDVDGQTGMAIGFAITDTDQQPQSTGYTNQDDEAFGLNSPFLTTNSEPWEQWGQIANPPYLVTYQVELDQHGQQAPFITAQPFDETDQRGETWWARDVDDQWAFNTPEIEGELLLEEEIQINNQPYSLWQQTEDEQFGERAPFITAQPFDDALDQIGRPWWAREQTEDTQHGQNPPFLTAQPFDEDQFTRQGLVYADEEIFSFDSALVQGQDEIPSSMDTLSLRQSDAEVGVTIAQDYSDTLGDYPQVLLRFSKDEVFGFQTQQLVEQEPDDVLQAKILSAREEDVFGMQAPFITSFPSDDALEQLGNKPYPIVAEDDLVFPASTILADMLYDADFNPTQQQSYYFGSEDLEKYNWGWMPPMTQVAEDDTPYDFPVITLQRWSNDEDFGQQVQFISLGQELEPIQNSYVANGHVDDDRTSAQAWGFDTVHLEGPNLKFDLLSDEEGFGFQQQFVMALEDGLEQFPTSVWARDEVELFGFQTAVVTAISAFEQDELPGIEKRMYAAEDEMFGFTVGFTQTPEQEALSSNSFVFGFDDERGIVTPLSSEPDVQQPAWQSFAVQDDDSIGLNVQFLMAWSGEEGQQPNQPQPVIPQTELEQVGLGAPFIQEVSLDWDVEQGSKYWAPWSIDQNDYNVGQISIGFIVPKIWNFTVACTIVMAQWSVRAMQKVWQMEAESTVAVQDCDVRAQIEVTDIRVIVQVQIQDFQVRA